MRNFNFLPRTLNILYYSGVSSTHWSNHGSDIVCLFVFEVIITCKQTAISWSKAHPGSDQKSCDSSYYVQKYMKVHASWSLIPISCFLALLIMIGTHMTWSHCLGGEGHPLSEHMNLWCQISGRAEYQMWNGSWHSDRTDCFRLCRGEPSAALSVCWHLLHAIYFLHSMPSAKGWYGYPYTLGS